MTLKIVNISSDPYIGSANAFMKANWRSFGQKIVNRGMPIAGAEYVKKTILPTINTSKIVNKPIETLKIVNKPIESGRSSEDTLSFEKRPFPMALNIDGPSTDPTNPDARPDYDNWGPDTFWSCADWITWHGALKKAFGKDKAKEIWDEAWNKQGVGEHAYEVCQYTTSFSDYVKKEGIMTPVWLADVTTGTVEVIENVSDAISNTSKMLKWLVPTVLIVGVVGLGIYGYKTFIATA